MLKLLLFALALPIVQAQVSDLNPNAPKPGTPAPELSFTHVLQAPADAKTDWSSLRGKVVVLEFWATWCAPCVAEIPVMNSLIASTDLSKVQFISVDDEDPAVVGNFLKKHPILGWIGIDNSGKLFDRFGVNARPTTMVIDSRGHVVNTTVRPEELRAEDLAALAAGKQVTFGNPEAAKLRAQVKAEMTKAMAEEKEGKESDALFEIVLSKGDEKGNARFMLRGAGHVQADNVPLTLLLSQGTGLPSDRIATNGQIPNQRYNLRVEAPNADPKRLAQAVELAIETAAHVEIRHSAADEKVYVLTAKPDAGAQMKPMPGTGGGALYDSKAQMLHCLYATPAQVANALETVLGTPVLDETGIEGKLMTNLQIVNHDAASAKAALAPLGFVLAEAKRPVERVVIAPLPATAGK